MSNDHPDDASPSVSLVLPTLNAKPYLSDLWAALAAQHPCPPIEIIFVDSGSTDGTTETAAALDPPARVIPIDRFSHGRARNLGARECRGDLVAFLSQDALPASPSWLAELIAPLRNPAVAAAFSRQVPRPDASPMEAFFLDSHFPADTPRVMRRPPSGEMLFMRDVFFSNVSSVIRRDVLLACPFDEDLIMSEDQQFARDAMLAGHAVAYAPGSAVIHSHNYGFLQALRRYVDSVYSLTIVFPKHSFAESARIGGPYLRREFATILRRHPAWLPRYLSFAAARAAGTILGHLADRLPRSVLRRVSMHAYHWR